MMHKKFVVTGKIGSGKSSFIKIIKEIGKYDIRSADEDARKIIEENLDLIQSYVIEIYSDNIDYKKLFFNDIILKRKIESYVYKILYENYRDLKLTRDMFFEIPLYFESKNIADSVGFKPDKIILIDSSKENRYKRLKEFRNMNKDEIVEREKFFMSDDYLKSNSDIIINNDYDYKTLKERTLKYFD